MHRTTIYLPDELHRDLRLLAWHTDSTIADLLRHAVDVVYPQDFAVARADDGKKGIPRALSALSAALKKGRWRRDRRFRWNKTRQL